MRCTFIAEHDTGARVTIPTTDKHGTPVTDVSAAYRECARLLRERPTAFRVECWNGTRYVTKAQREVPISGPELLAAMDAAPISRETCDAILEGMASNETPYVCPGCHAVGGERCAPGCIDAEMEADYQHAIESGDYSDETPPPRTRETIAAEREGHGGECMKTCCVPSRKDDDSAPL